MIRRIVLCVLSGVLLANGRAYAQWPDGGALVCGSALDERGARCVADGTGRFWVAWGASSPDDTTPAFALEAVELVRPRSRRRPGAEGRVLRVPDHALGRVTHGRGAIVSRR